MARIVYIGDINVEHGGTWFKIDPRDWDEHGYCSAVRVTPCSDAGLQENAWWIEELTVLNPDGDDMKRVLSCSGWSIDPDDGSIISCSGNVVARKGTAAFRQALAEACVSYGKYDVEHSITVQIGKEPEDSSECPAHADRVLRANASLERYVRREFLRSM